MESRPLVVPLSRGGRGAAADHQLLRRDRDLRWHPGLHDDHADRPVLVRRPVPRHGGRRGGCRWPTAPWRGRGAGHPTSGAEALAVGVPDEVKGEALVVFVVPRASPGGAPPDLVAAVAATVTEQLGKSFRPSAVHVVPALPKTRNGQILRRLARAAYLRLAPGDTRPLE